MRIRSLLALFFLSLNFGFAGNQDAVYLQEGFNGTGLPAGWSQVRISGTQALWSVVGVGSNPTVPPYAGAGQAKFNSFDAAVGEQARLTSPALNLITATDPFLSFFMYHEDEYFSSFDSLYVEASTGDSINGPWTVLQGVRRPRVTPGWTKEVISLYAYRGISRMFLSLRGVSKYGNNIFADEFRVADSTFHDIGPVGLLVDGQLAAQHSPSPRSGATGSRIISGKPERSSSLPPFLIRVANDASLNIGAVIRNYGTFSENSYALSWRINAQLQAPVNGGPIAARTGRDTLTLTWATPVAGTHTVTAWTVLSTDSTRSNDTTSLIFHVIDTATVFYESFNGAAFPPVNWTTINRDGGALAPWFRGADTSAFVPFEGSGFAANNFQRANNRYLDDYLITPSVPGVGQIGRVDSLIFWVRSKFNTAPAQNFPDSLMILLSTSGSDTSNFTTHVDYFAIPKTSWTRKAYQLTGRVPANSSVRVAFRYLLYDAGFSGNSGDFIGIDVVQIVRKLPAAVNGNPPTPTRFALQQNYPNPFNPTTTIRFTVAATSFVTLKVFDVLGRKIATLLNETQQPGTYDAIWDARELSSGLYIVRLAATGNFTHTKFVTYRKMLLLK